MKQRLFTALIGVAFAIGWLFTMYTPFFAGILGLFAVFAEYEILKVFEVKNAPFAAVCLVISAAVLVYPDYSDRIHIPLFPAVTAAVLVSLIIMVCCFKKLSFEQVVCSLFGAALIPAALSCILLFRDVYKTFPGTFSKTDGVFFILFAFFCSWLTDTCALFAGMALGKHKLAPEISPKKTVEGAIGGVLGNCLFCAALYFVFAKKFSLGSAVKLYYVIPAALVLSVISIFGDLAASTIKRRHGIKDFGNLLPGHGGVLDRFDSCLFVFPALYSFILLIGQ